MKESTIDLEKIINGVVEINTPLSRSFEVYLEKGFDMIKRKVLLKYSIDNIN